MNPFEYEMEYFSGYTDSTRKVLIIDQIPVSPEPPDNFSAVYLVKDIETGAISTVGINSIKNIYATKLP